MNNQYTLQEYLNIDNPFKNNYIDIIKLDILFNDLQNTNKNIKYDSINHRTIFNNVNNNNNTIILSCNPDCDFPMPKYDIFKYQDNQFDNTIQTYLDELNYYEKINISLLDTIPNNINKIFCNSIGKEHEKLVMIPIGRDFKNKHLFNEIDTLTKNNKTILCYYNCTMPPNIIHWYGMIRPNILEIANLLNQVHCNFIDIEYCNTHPRIYNDHITIHYYKKILSSKFMICPRGCGIDTYRMWDCIYLGCIPIVEKYDGYKQFEDLPILFVNHWKDIENLTPNYLEEVYFQMLHKKYNYNKLDINYWKKQILNSI
jgi:hypothetical protein